MSMNTIPFTVKTIRPGTTEFGITEPKIIFDCFAWGEWDITFCAHGIKLRWHCDDCAEYFGENEAADDNQHWRDVEAVIEDRD